MDSGETEKSVCTGALNMLFRLVIILSVLLPCSLVQARIPSGYIKMAKSYNIPEKIFYAVILQESSSTTKKGFKPWPWTLNIKGKGYRYSTRRAAYNALTNAIKNQTTLVDVGLGQVNWRWHKDKFKSPWSALEPYTNLRVAAKILRQEYSNSGGDWWKAVGRYHSPGQKPKQKQRAKNYSAMVKKRYQRITI